MTPDKPDEAWKTAYLRYWFGKLVTQRQIASPLAREVFKAGWDAALQQVISKMESKDE